MGIIAEIEDKFIDEIDHNLANDKAYQDAIRNLHNFIQNNIPKEKEDECGDLVAKLTSTILHISFQTGMKLGAKLADELLS